MLRQSAFKLSKRAYATFPKTVSTTSPNGITVSTDNSASSQVATVGIYAKGGSRLENKYNNGLSTLSNHVIYKPSVAFAESLEKSGAKFDAFVAKESNGFSTTAPKGKISEAFPLLAEASLAPKFTESTIEAVKPFAVAEIEAGDADYYKSGIDYATSVGFQGTSMALPPKGISENIAELGKMDSEKHLAKSIAPDNLVVAGSGAVEHEELVKLVEKSSGSLSTAPVPSLGPKPEFTGSDIRIRDDTIPHCYISILVPGPGAKSPDFFPALVAAEVFGDYYAHAGNAALTSSGLSQIVNDFHLAEKYSSFSHSFSDIGVWGITIDSKNLTSLDDLVHFTLKQWNRLTVSSTDAEVARAKAAAKTKFLQSLRSTEHVANSIGTQTVVNGRAFSYGEMSSKIDAVDVSAISKWASYALWDKDIAVSAIGSVEGVLDYQRIRNDMSMSRW